MIWEINGDSVIVSTGRIGDFISRDNFLPCQFVMANNDKLRIFIDGNYYNFNPFIRHDLPKKTFMKSVVWKTRIFYPEKPLALPIQVKYGSGTLIIDVKKHKIPIIFLNLTLKHPKFFGNAVIGLYNGENKNYIDGLLLLTRNWKCITEIDDLLIVDGFLFPTCDGVLFYSPNQNQNLVKFYHENILKDIPEGDWMADQFFRKYVFYFSDDNASIKME